MDEMSVWDEGTKTYVRILSRRAYYDETTRAWVCSCDRFARRRKCQHIIRWRPEKTVPVKGEYL